MEVGNVLSHYFEVRHEIVDKHEKAKGVVNQDVADLRLPKKYDLIVSISTLEHVGWDENPNYSESAREPDKVIIAFEKLKASLKTGGEIVVTLPIGYNPYLDVAIGNGKIDFDKMFCLRRISKNRWIETNWENVRKLKFGSPFPFANGLVIGTIERG